MSQKLKEGRVVNFSDKEVKQQALNHVDKSSEGDFGERPFVSAGWNWIR